MVYNSYSFLLAFLPIVLIGCYVFRRFRWDWRIWLLVASFAYFALNGAQFIPFGILELTVNYAFYCAMRRSRRRRLVFILAAAANVLVLFVYKYLGFAVSVLNLLLRRQFYVPEIALPTGISFITFQQIVFLADAYRNPSDGKVSFRDYSLFVSFFPKLVSGPIVPSGRFFLMLAGERRMNWDRAASGIMLFSAGLAKKVLLADALAGGADYVYNHLDSINAVSMLFASVVYSLQIYFDFSGYSDMAVGIARMLGLDLPYNFNSPYRADNIADFWDRWHMSLTWFLTHYVYIPLGGNRRGAFRTYFNILIVFLVSGIWHGASFTFIAWGLLHGVFMIVHRFLGKRFTLPKVSGRILTLLLVNLAWILFRAGDLTTMRSVFAVFSRGGWTSLSRDMCAAMLPASVSAYIGETAITASAVVFAAAAAGITQLAKNSQMLAEKERYSVTDALCAITLGLVSLMSLSGVTHFIYAYF